MSNTRTVTGLTTEGHPFWMTATYAPGAPGSALPLSLVGSYSSSDGGGVFCIELRADGLYYLGGDDRGYGGRENPNDLVPWVISEAGGG